METASSQRVIAKIYRDFRPKNSGWLIDAMEWIGEAILWINAYYDMEDTVECLTVCDYKVKIPCGVTKVEGISYQGQRLRMTGQVNFARCGCAELNTMSCHPIETYKPNPGWYHFSFPEGEIKMYVRKLPVDCDGFPLIVDNVKYIEAVTWYVFSKMLLRGYNHPELKYKDALNLWNIYYPQARNSVRMPNIDRYERFKQSWVTLTLDYNKAEKFFAEEGTGTTGNINTIGDPRAINVEGFGLH